MTSENQDGVPDEMVDLQDVDEILNEIGIISNDSSSSSSQDHHHSNATFRPETGPFLRTLDSYLKCRNGLDAKYLEIDESRLLANLEFEADSGGILQPQQSVAARPAKSLKELFEAASAIRPIYCEKLNGLVTRIRQAFPLAQETDIELILPPLKGEQRAVEKALDDYSERSPGPPTSWVYDINRASIEFSSAEQLIKCLELLKADESIYIVQSKNRFQNPGLSGYRDWNLHLRIVNPEQSEDVFDFEHVCELQLHHKAIRILGKQQDSHRLYEYFRSYFAGATASLKERLDDFQTIGCAAALGGEEYGLFLNSLLKSTATATDEQLKRLADLFFHFLCEYNTALQLYASLLGRHRDNLNHYGIVTTLSIMAMVLLDQDKLDHAETFSQRALTISKEKNLPNVSDLYYDMAKVLEEKKEYERCMEMYDEAMTMNKTTMGENHSYVGCIYVRRGLIRVEQGNYDEAMRELQDGLGILERNLREGQYSSFTAKWRALAHRTMGTFFQRNNDLLRAEGEFEKALELYIEALGKGHSQVQEAHDLLCDVRNVMEETGQS